MLTNTVRILEGNTFVLSDSKGDIQPALSEPTGLFHRDTRFLSQWQLSINGGPLTTLSVDDLQYFSARFFLVPGASSVYVNSTLTVIRTRSVGDGFREQLTVYNHSPKPAHLTIRMEAAADFADLFEVKDMLKKQGQLTAQVEDGTLVFHYQRDQFERETRISSSSAAAIDLTGFSYDIEVPPQGEWQTNFDVTTSRDGSPEAKTQPKYHDVDDQARPNMELSLEDWLAQAPSLHSSWEPLGSIYRRSLVDLAALRYTPAIVPGKAIPAAGLPWFMAIFGRDSLITSLQALPFTAELAATTLQVLAARQGLRVDPFRDEEPGKILHEQRQGELTAFEERPHSPYYGSADSTPLFLILLDEYERWTGDTELVRTLEPVARAALEWIDRYGDRDGDGYVEYERGRDTGLENQCWKDSWDSIIFRDGSMSDLPRACCEIQGYVYDAKRRCARLARRIWDDQALATALEYQAAELKRRFNDDFWVADGSYFALALDGQKRRVDSLTSNIGHLLWSDIVDGSKVQTVVDHLMSDRLFSGWGVRTMSTQDAGYNPIGYHTGAVWPHDNSIIALGLLRQGRLHEASAIAGGILEAATYFNFRLPEAFAGYPRELTHFPVEYPTACSPQAWATGAPLLFLRTMLGLEPAGDDLQIGAALPPFLTRLELRNISFRGFRIDALGGQLRTPDAEAIREPVRAPGADELAPTPTAEAFFERLGAREDWATGRPPEGTASFDVAGHGKWSLRGEEGRVIVSREEVATDVVFMLDEEVLLAMADRRQNAMTAFLSGQVRVAGDVAAAERFVRAIF